MRHHLLPLAVAPRPSGVREAPRTRVLVASPSLAQTPPARLLATPHTAVPLPAVAAAAQQHFTLAQHTRVHPPRVTHSTLGPDSRHRSLRSELPSASGVAVLKRWTRPVRQCNTLPALCALHGGARRFEQLAGRLGRRARSDPRAAPFYCSARYTRKASGPQRPAAPTRDADPRHLPAAPAQAHAAPPRTPPPQACPRRRAGGACDETDRPPRWASRVPRASFASPSSMQPNPPAASCPHPRPTPACWVSFGERRWVSFDERQSRCASSSAGATGCMWSTRPGPAGS
jgi:hypothetical protein